MTAVAIAPIPRIDTGLRSLTWPLARLGEAVEVLSRRCGFLSQSAEVSTLTERLAYSGEEAIGQRIDQIAGALGLEVEPIAIAYESIQGSIAALSPALILIDPDSDAHDRQLLVLLKSNRRRLTVIAPDLVVRRIRADVVTQALQAQIDAPMRHHVAQLLAHTGVAGTRRAGAERALLRQWIGRTPLSSCWLLRPLPGASTLLHMRIQRLPHYILILFGAQLLQQMLFGLEWWFIGRGALQGSIEQPWLWAWALLLLTAIPLQLLASWCESVFANKAGAYFKTRLLYGAMQLDPEAIRHQGVGQFFSRMMEADTVETLALYGGFTVLTGTIGIVSTIALLTYGVRNQLLLAVFAGWIVLTLLLGWRYWRASRLFTDMNRMMTNDLVERMVGYRTRLAQEHPARWHLEEDRMLARYLTLAGQVQRANVGLKAFIPKSWLVVGVLACLPVWLAQGHPTSIAVSLGGLLMASQALRTLSGGLKEIINLVVSWQQVAPTYHAAARRESQGPAELVSLLGAATAREREPAQPVLMARDLSFRYPSRSQPVLQECGLRIQIGDRVLLEGASGGGKSTLGSILTGLRKPTSGLLLLWGLDQQTLGSPEWRRRVVAAPQFHENHVLSGTFAFNLLLGRHWPPSPEDLAEAEVVCRELGLGELLDRMPAGMQQTVGECGWQLSHGERSRLFIARALLQNADVIVLDESFAALDPENLQRALRCVFTRAPALLVIAHP